VEFFKDDVNTLVCGHFSEAYFELNRYILQEGIKTNSRVGLTLEVLNFKTVIQKPLFRSAVAPKRCINIFFHLAESLWVLTGRNDLTFIQLFNSRFARFSDDGESLHGGYGKRLRKWEGKNGDLIDQLFTLTSHLQQNPDLRRSVISLWDPSLDLANPSKDIPCNTQLVLRVKDKALHLTVFNRSNDLHWGYVANIFQFSFLGEMIALLLGKKFVKQTHISQSLHLYLDNKLHEKMEPSALHETFYQKYQPAAFDFSFLYPVEHFASRFKQWDNVFKQLPEQLIQMYDSTSSVIEFDRLIQPLKVTSVSLYEIAYLLGFYLHYKKQISKSIDINAVRVEFAEDLLQKNDLNKFRHQDYFALALNYLVHRMETESVERFKIQDQNMGNY
jgi:thymidylate synthase